VAAQTDGKVLIGGSFTTVDDVARTRIARLNADGSLDTSFDAGTGADSAVRSVVVQADGKVLIGGDFTTVDGVARNRIARLNADGSLDTGFDPGTGANAGVQAVAVQADGKVLIGGSFITVDDVARTSIARLNVDGSLDTSFDPDLIAGTGGDWVNAVAVQADGKVLIGGHFETVDNISRNHIARLNTNGTLDTSFDPGTGASAVVNALAVQNDEVIVGGAFATIDGVSRPRIARLDSDGSVDTSFDPGDGMNNNVWSVAVQVDGKVLAGGTFTEVDGTGRNRVARLNGDGSLDVGLDPGTGASNQVEAVVHQADGKVLIGGYFTTVDGEDRKGIARLNANGSLDTSFDPGTGADPAVVRAVAVQPDGQVFIGGNFTKVNNMTRNRIARLSALGAVDTGFDPGAGADDQVLTVAVHDGGVLIGGYFTTVGGAGRKGIARLNSSGAVDNGFNPVVSGENEWVLSLAVQDDDKVIIGGSFTTVNGVARKHVARLNANGTLDSSFDPGIGPNFLVRAVAVQDDGKVLIGGSFTTVSGEDRKYIARLTDTGSLDTSFDPVKGASSWVDAVAVQADGKVLIGGDFTTVNDVNCNHIARLNANGSVDTSFVTSAGADDTVYDVAVQPDGKVLIGGDFNRKVARLNGATPPAITSGAASSTAALGVDYSHAFTASGYPWAPEFYLAGGSLPSGLTLDATTGVLSGKPASAGTYAYTVSACNYVAPCATDDGTFTIAKEDSTTTITAHTPDPSVMGQAVTVAYSVTSEVVTPTGDVTVGDGTDSCTGTVADASCSLTFTTVGTKTLTATYAGDGNLNPSTSAAVTHRVNERGAYTIYLPLIRR
jgi:uncharacterized delta-60 repeat protein